MRPKQTYAVRPASRAEIDRPMTVSISLSGISGTGKTYSACEIAAGLAEGVTGKAGAPFAYVDTEGRRGLHYRDAFPQMLDHYYDFGPLDDAGNLVGYPPERWIALFDKIEASGVTALVVDAFSHSWEGIGGVLELQALELDRLCAGDETKAERMNWLAWAAIKPRHRRLIDKIIRSRVNMVLCNRAKKVIKKWDHASGAYVPLGGKRRIADIPYDSAGDENLIYEMTAALVLDPEHPGCPRYAQKLADSFKTLFKPDQPITASTGRGLADWSLRRGSAQDEKALMDRARAEARKGRAAFVAFWQALDRPQRMVVSEILDDCRALTELADISSKLDAADPFGAPAPEPETEPEAAPPPARKPAARKPAASRRRAAA